MPHRLLGSSKSLTMRFGPAALRRLYSTGARKAGAKRKAFCPEVVPEVFTLNGVGSVF